MSEASKLAKELTALTAQIDAIESHKRDIGFMEVGGVRLISFHGRAYEQCREHVVAILKAARADLLVEVAKVVGLPARFEEATEEAVIVQQPTPPAPPALPEDDDAFSNPD